MRLISRTWKLALPMVALAGLAAAQSAVDVFAGAGTATDGSIGQSVNTFGDGTYYNTSALHGALMTFGGSLFLTPQFGVGGEIALRPGKGDYAGLKYRPMFYDFNGIWKPKIKGDKIVPEFQAGIGGVSLRYYYNQESCSALIGCISSSSYLVSANHFQGHFGAGVRFYVTPSVYIKPEVDLHLVNNFTQFSSNLVKRYSVVIGYTLGNKN